MAEYIKCRNCESPDCKGCNIKNMETMLENGAFDCLMNENRCINTSADVVTEQEYCPFCGAKMDLEQFGKDEHSTKLKGENENERF